MEALRGFAFFAANFGYSRSEYLELTPAERLFLYKEYENRLVTASNLLAAAVANAVGNVLRKKGKPPQKLWKKKPVQGDLQERENDLQIALDVQKQDGSDWIRKIYAANFRIPGNGGEKQ